MTERKVTVERNTLETQVKATINLDGTGEGRFGRRWGWLGAN